MLPDIYQKLGIMGLPLVVCSILATMLIFERCIFYVFSDFGGRKLTHRGLHILLLHQHKSREIRDEIASVALSGVKRPYSRGLAILRMIAAVSPILGLLGTILGIIDAFRVIAASTNPVTPNMIADGLWEALLTTAFGLMIALPALIVAIGLTAMRNSIFEKTSAKLNAYSLELALNERAPDTTENRDLAASELKVAL